MTATYRLKGLGWMTSSVAIALGFYLFSLQVAAERKRVEAVSARIAVARRDIRALETEFSTRANLAQLERWNGDTLALAAPGVGQFVRDTSELAALDPAHTPAMQTAALVVPTGLLSAPTAVALATATPAPVTSAPVAVASVATKRGSDQLAALAAKVAIKPVSLIRATAKDMAGPTKRAPGGRPEAIASLGDDLLSQGTLGAILSGAQAERKRRQ